MNLAIRAPRRLKQLIKRWFAYAGYQVFPTGTCYAQDGLITIHNDRFRRTAAFRDAYLRGVTAGNGVDPGFDWRLHVALWAAELGSRVAGDFVECGVNAGFISSAIMQRLQWNRLNRRYYLVDTFSGPPVFQFSDTEVQLGRRRIAEDAIAAGAYVTDLSRVRENFAEWPSAVVVQGLIPDVLSTLPVEQVAFLHIDMNCAYPEQAALEHFWGRLSSGAVVLLDDYAYHGYDQQTDAMDTVAERVGANILSLPTGQGLIIR